MCEIRVSSEIGYGFIGVMTSSLMSHVCEDRIQLKGLAVNVNKRPML